MLVLEEIRVRVVDASTVVYNFFKFSHSKFIGHLLETLFGTSMDPVAVHLLNGKQGDILGLPGVKYLDRHTNLATHLGNLPCIELQYFDSSVKSSYLKRLLDFLVSSCRVTSPRL